MFYYIELFIVSLHLGYLYHHYREAKHQIIENDKVLMLITTLVIISMPALGFLRFSLYGTIGVILFGWFIGHVKRKEMFLLTDQYTHQWRLHYVKWRPFPCLIISIVGLFSWALYL